MLRRATWWGDCGRPAVHIESFLSQRVLGRVHTVSVSETAILSEKGASEWCKVAEGGHDK